MKRKRQEVQPCATFAQLVKSKRLDPNGVEVFQLNDGMGKRVKTLRAFRRGQIVCSYGGKCYLDVDNELYENNAYQCAITDTVTMDGNPDFEETKGHTGVFINDAEGPIKEKNARNNVYFSYSFIRGENNEKIPTLWLRAKRHLKKGEELWLSYGKEYWTSRAEIEVEKNLQKNE